MKADYIIIQAGGRGSRLESLTTNKPKALVPVNNKPIVEYFFEKFHGSKFIIIGDYKIDILKRYISNFYKKEKIIFVKSKKKGTNSGIHHAMKYIPKDTPFVLSWCDLMIGKKFSIPNFKEDALIGLSSTFNCRWSLSDDQFLETPSSTCGICGFFVFKNKQILKDVPSEGEFVRYLSTKKISLSQFIVKDVNEIGTVLAYNQNNVYHCRSFNMLTIGKKKVIKEYVNDYGRRIAFDEINWYKKVKDLNLKFLPKIYSYKPLTIEKIDHIQDFSALDLKEKKLVVNNIINAFNSMHNLFGKQDCVFSDILSSYYSKTFLRLDAISNALPFNCKRNIIVNGFKCDSPYVLKRKIKKIIFELFKNDEFVFIHGDPTLSNVLIRPDLSPVFIDPRGYFGVTKLFGDKYYDYSKLYYSLVGNYDEFNKKRFLLEINGTNITVNIKSNGFEEFTDKIFEENGIDLKRVKFLHSLIWLSLTEYTKEDYDSIVASYALGCYYLNKFLKEYDK